MKRPLLAATAALFLVTWLATTLFSEDKPAPTKLGFLDVARAFNSYRRTKDLNEALNGKADAVLQDLKRRNAAIEQKAERLNTLNEGSDERVALERELTLEQQALEYDRKSLKQNLERERIRTQAMIYREIVTEAQAYAQEQGLAAVMNFSPLDPDFERHPNSDIIMNTRSVLCRDEQLDITDQIVQRLNSMLPPKPVAPEKQSQPVEKDREDNRNGEKGTSDPDKPK